ncbi:MAG: hypothetical protein OXC55_04190 [Chloroflexi bacterium]|nr:hypothetical protein [Chloroflexota bacterium]
MSLSVLVVLATMWTKERADLLAENGPPRASVLGVPSNGMPIISFQSRSGRRPSNLAMGSVTSLGGVHVCLKALGTFSRLRPYIESRAVGVWI